MITSTVTGAPEFSAEIAEIGESPCIQSWDFAPVFDPPLLNLPFVLLEAYYQGEKV